VAGLGGVRSGLLEWGRRLDRVECGDGLRLQSGGRLRRGSLEGSVRGLGQGGEGDGGGGLAAHEEGLGVAHL
jgi:hypothetical protein